MNSNTNIHNNGNLINLESPMNSSNRGNHITDRDTISENNPQPQLKKKTHGIPTSGAYKGNGDRAEPMVRTHTKDTSESKLTRNGIRPKTAKTCHSRTRSPPYPTQRTACHKGTTGNPPSNRPRRHQTHIKGGNSNKQIRLWKAQLARKTI